MDFCDASITLHEHPHPPHTRLFLLLLGKLELERDLGREDVGPSQNLGHAVRRLSATSQPVLGSLRERREGQGEEGLSRQQLGVRPGSVEEQRMRC